MLAYTEIFYIAWYRAANRQSTPVPMGAIIEALRQMQAENPPPPVDKRVEIVIDRAQKQQQHLAHALDDFDLEICPVLESSWQSAVAQQLQ